MQSLRIKLALIIAIASIVILGAISYMNYNKTAAILTEQIQSAAMASVESNARVIDEWLTGIQKEVEALSRAEEVQSLEPERYMPLIKEIVEKQEDCNMIFVVDIYGGGKTTMDSVLNVADRDYFIEAMETGKTVISEPLYNRATGDLVYVIVIGTPVYRDGEKVGFVGATVTLGRLQKLVSEMKLGGHGYGFIQGADMTTIAHPELKWQGNKKIVDSADERLAAIFEHMSKGETGFAEYTYEGINKVMAYAPLKTTDWSIAQTANVADIMAPLDEMRNNNLIFSVVGLLIMIGISFAIASFVAKPLVKLSDVAGLVAGGDLTQKIDVRGKDEVGRVSSAFNEMIESLREMTIALRDKATSLASSAQQLSASAEETSAGTSETASTIAEVASTVEHAAQNALTIREVAEDTKMEAEKGRTGIKNVTEQMESISDSTQSVARAISSLEAASSKISMIVETITDIANQTNLLALNAAIEAARAGEQGRGFAVVADEVRKLAEESASAAQEIQKLISSVQKETRQASEAMGHGTGEVKKGVEIVEEVGLVFAGIIDKVNGLAERVDEIASGTEQVSAAVQNVASTTEEVTAAMEEMASSTETLNLMAEELQNMAARFKVDDDTAMEDDTLVDDDKSLDNVTQNEESESQDIK